MSKIISFKEGKKNLLENRKEKQIPISQKTINQRETKKATPQSTEPEMGILIWLYCPNCKTLQYTENQASNGRKHKCGADVMEIAIRFNRRKYHLFKKFKYFRRTAATNANDILLRLLEIRLQAILKKSCLTTY